MAQVIKDIVTWLKQWFYTKSDIDKLIVDEEEYSSSSTSTLTKILNPNYKLDNGLNWIFSCDIKITGNVSSRLELSPYGLDRGHHISIGVNTAGTSSLWWTPESDSGETGETITTLVKNTYYHLDFVKQDNSISIYLDNVVLKTLTFDWFKKYDFLVKLTTWGTANNGISVKNIYINHKNVQVSPNEVGEYIVGTHGTSTTATWTGTCNKLTEIKDGTTIFYYLTSAGTTNVTLNLTLANGQTTGAKNVYFKGTTRLSTHYPINSIITLVYTTKRDNGCWYVSSANDNNSYNASHYGTVQFTAGEALTTRTLCGMMSDGKYYKISSGRQFLTAYPIIGTNGAIAVNATGNNEYMPRYDEAITNTKSMTLTNGKPVFIEGSDYRNGVFTVSSNVVTQTLSQGKYYWLVGFAYGNSNFRSNRYENILYYNGTNLIPVAYPLSHTHSIAEIDDGYLNMIATETGETLEDILSDYVQKESNKALFPSSNYIIDSNTPFGYKISSNQTQSLFSVLNTLISQSETSPTMELVHSQSFKGCTIKWYSDGLYVYMVVNGTFSSINASSTSSGYTNCGTMTNTDYAPPSTTVKILQGVSNLSTITITDTGVVGIHNKTTGTSINANTTLMYPLKSRMP